MIIWFMSKYHNSGGSWFPNDLLRNLERANVAEIISYVQDFMKIPIAYYHIKLDCINRIEKFCTEPYRTYLLTYKSFWNKRPFKTTPHCIFMIPQELAWLRRATTRFYSTLQSHQFLIFWVKIFFSFHLTLRNLT